MKQLLAILAATTALAGAAQAQDITEFNIGILGGENAQDRLTNQECFRAKIEEALGVPTKLFAPADYDGVIRACWVARSIMHGSALRPLPRST